MSFYGTRESDHRGEEMMNFDTVEEKQVVLRTVQNILAAVALQTKYGKLRGEPVPALRTGDKTIAEWRRLAKQLRNELKAARKINNRA